nr:MAG TPA: hypothetical protein [Caudoviricetes sp.]
MNFFITFNIIPCTFFSNRPHEIYRAPQLVLYLYENVL